MRNWRADPRYLERICSHYCGEPVGERGEVLTYRCPLCGRESLVCNQREMVVHCRTPGCELSWERGYREFISRADDIGINRTLAIEGRAAEVCVASLEREEAQRRQAQQSKDQQTLQLRKNIESEHPFVREKIINAYGLLTSFEAKVVGAVFLAVFAMIAVLMGWVWTVEAAIGAVAALVVAALPAGYLWRHLYMRRTDKYALEENQSAVLLEFSDEDNGAGRITGE